MAKIAWLGYSLLLYEKKKTDGYENQITRKTDGRCKNTIYWKYHKKQQIQDSRNITVNVNVLNNYQYINI